MGIRKVNHASVKISKHHQEKQNFNSLIEVLRPKVYITESSSFKKLVQELTGNSNNNGSSLLTTTSTTLSPTSLEQNMVVDEITTTTTTTISNTADGSVSTEETSNYYSSDYAAAALMNDDEFNQVCNQLCLDDELGFQHSKVASQQPMDQLLAFQNLESLLFDVETNNDPFYNCYLQPDVSIYDYELSGLL